jgi:hypothetical protein
LFNQVSDHRRHGLVEEARPRYAQDGFAVAPALRQRFFLSSGLGLFELGEGGVLTMPVVVRGWIRGSMRAASTWSAPGSGCLTSTPRTAH